MTSTTTTQTRQTHEAAGMSGRFYQAIPRDELDAIRAARHDEAGNPLDTLIHRDGGAPLRCCLRETRPAERVLLTGGVGSRTACWSRTDARPRPSSKNS
jgi:hypothetical protein